MNEFNSALQIQAQARGMNLSERLGLSGPRRFLSRCFDHGLLRYIYEVFERDQKPSSYELYSLLETANFGVKHSSWGQEYELGIERGVQPSDLWSESQLQLTRWLFRLGVDPNIAKLGVDPNYTARSPEGTPWTSFLDVILEFGFPDGDRAKSAFSILEEYTKHGATLQSIPRGSYRGPLGYKWALKGRMSKEQFDTLLRLADSKRHEDRLVAGLMRIPKLWKFLKNIGRHG